MRKANYDKEPVVKVSGYDQQSFQGYKSIVKKLEEEKKLNKIIIVDCYPGVRIEEIVTGFKLNMQIDKVIYSDDFAFSGEEITKQIQRNLTDDRVFGVMSHFDLAEFFNEEKLREARNFVSQWKTGNLLIIGFGASLITRGDLLIYADMARWEIQQRYRSKELANWKMSNHEEDILRKYKRGFFVEWRMADRHKKKLFHNIDYVMDTNLRNMPKMISKEAFFKGLEEAIKRPFRVVPFFDPGVWGGQWMKDVCDLDRSKENYAWGFDCVPEENSLYLQFGEIRFEMPSINLVLEKPIELLGDRVHARFGSEFPIRFDFLDTIGGQNLSLQVHPITEYIQEHFGMHYTQDESYYILDAVEDTHVYLGVKKGIDSTEMILDLERAQKGECSFNAEAYINQIPAKKHDHFLIPAGTIHCSGAGSMVLEVSATPYIFTFKLWDWDRVGLDGLPRPVHINLGKEVIQFDRDTEWVMNNLVGQVEKVAEGDGWLEERTGLHQREFIETRRHWFSKPVIHETNGSVNVLNLIEGDEAIVESLDHSFEPFIIHYAETFIVPDAVNQYQIRPYGLSEGKEIATLKAFIRF